MNICTQLADLVIKRLLNSASIPLMKLKGILHPLENSRHLNKASTMERKGYCENYPDKG